MAVLLICAAGLCFAQQATAPETAPAAPAAPAAAPATGAPAPWTKTVPLKAEDTLTIYVDPGNVVLIPSEKKEITIKVEGLPKEEAEKVQVTGKEKDVKIDYRGQKSTVGKFSIYVPSPFNLDVFSSGDIDAQGALSGKSLRLRATTGSIQLGDVSGTLTVDCTEADITIGNIHGNANLSTNGDIDVEDITGDFSAKNRSGDTYAKNVSGNVDARADDGDVSIGEVGGNATVSAGIGDVDLQKVTGVATITTQDGDIDLFEVPGMVVAQSGSGEITLHDVTGAADAKTEDGDITAEMFSGTGGSSKFYSRDGDISMFFPPSAKATVSAKFHSDTSGGTKEDAADEADDVITADWKPANSQKQGGDIVNKYEIGGGGDAILLETVTGELTVKKLVPKPETKPAAKKPN